MVIIGRSYKLITLGSERVKKSYETVPTPEKWGNCGTASLREGAGGGGGVKREFGFRLN